MGITHHIGLEIAERSFRFVEIQQQDRQSTVLRADTLETTRDFASDILFEIPFDRGLAREFITDLATVYHRHTVYAGSISLVLPATLPLVFTVPVDSTLSETERRRHLQWECTTLANLPSDTRMRMLTHELGKNGGTTRYLVVALPQSLVDFLSQTCEYLTLDLVSIDIDHFAMENVLRRLYPHDASQHYAVAGLHAGHCSVGRYDGGSYLGYRMAGISYRNHYAEQVLRLVDALQPPAADALQQLYVFGDAATPHVLDALENVLSCRVARCVPLADTEADDDIRRQLDGTGERVFDASAAAALMGPG